MKVELQAGYVLHTRPFKDSSLILDCFTRDYGRLSLLAKGARSQKSRQRQLCQPFIPLSLSWQGKSDLKTLTHIEAAKPQYRSLQGDYLFSGFYVNELMVRVLSPNDSSSELYQHYHNTLENLYAAAPLQTCLRQFEWALLQEQGYGISFQFDADANPLLPSTYYRWQPEAGWLATAEAESDWVYSGSVYKGQDLLAMGSHVDSGRLSNTVSQNHSDMQPATLRAAKRLSRLLLKPLLGDKPLQSRQLFQRRPTDQNSEISNLSDTDA